MLRILDQKDFCENLEEITSLKPMAKKKFHPKGLFSEQIFGPIKNYTCQCGKYMGLFKSGEKCKDCGVYFVNSDIRRKRYAKINLPLPVVNPIFYDLLVEIGGKVMKDAIDTLMKNDKSFLYMIDEDHALGTDLEEIPEGTRIWEKNEAIYKLVKEFAEIAIIEGDARWKIILDNIDNLFLESVIVLPPDLRPSSKGGSGQQLMDKINRYYVQILTKKEAMKETLLNLDRDKKTYYYYFRQIQKEVNELYSRILEKMAKKEGLIRGNILGKRIDFSGRAVIVPDPTINLDDCILPYTMLLEIFKIPIAKKLQLMDKNKYAFLNKAFDFVDECIELNKPSLYKVCEEVIEDQVCILNRQPSLHKLSMLGFNIKMSPDNIFDKIIKIHPLSCPPFNADFDGDQMAVYIPISEGSKIEVVKKIMITKNLSSPANENLTTIPNQDIILGIYFITSGLFCDKEEGLKIFNNVLPDGYPKVSKPVDRKYLLEILNDIKNTYDTDITSKVLDDVKKIGFMYATLYGTTMSLDDCYFADSQKIRDKIYSGSDWKKQLKIVVDKKIDNIVKKDFKYSYMIDSGARGSWDQVKQLVLTRGFISNFDGMIIDQPIKHSLIDGLTEEEFFNSTYGCRKGLLDVALNTGTSGYLSRKLIFTCANLQIDPDNKDCGTSDYLSVFVDSERKAKMLLKRYYNHDGELKQITEENYQSFINKVIEIRSPILCKTPKVCTACYGDLYKTVESRFIGIIAAQTLGERGTQLVLRTFHTSGSASIKGQDSVGLKQEDIIGDLAKVSELLHKFKGKTYTDIVHELFHAYDKDIHHVHFECVVAQLMWKGSRKWRLLESREKIEPVYYSIQSVPNQESWILAMAFSNPKRSIINGILNPGKYSGIMDKILKGEKI